MCPNGSELAFFRRPDLWIATLSTDAGTDLVVVTLTRQLTRNGPNATWFKLSWSPDDTQIAFQYLGGASGKQAFSSGIGKVFVHGAPYGVPDGASYGIAYGFRPDWSPMYLPPLR